MYISYDRKEVWAVASLFVQSNLLEYRELMTHTSLGFQVREFKATAFLENILFRCFCICDVYLFSGKLWSREFLIKNLSETSLAVMRRAYERGTKARLSFSGGPHAPVNMADSMEEVNEGEKNRRKWHVCCAVLRCISYAKFSQIFEVLREFHRLFGSRNSPTTGILHTIRHVYRSVWPDREAKPRFGAALDRSAHDCETRLFLFYFEINFLINFQFMT